LALPFNQLAWFFHQQGEDRQGLPLAQLAVQFHPDDAEYLDTLAVLLCQVGEHAEAIRTMERAADLRPQQFKEKLTRFHRGVCQ
jgi:Flp pilus assembly protein TadD